MGLSLHATYSQLLREDKDNQEVKIIEKLGKIAFHQGMWTRVFESSTLR